MMAVTNISSFDNTVIKTMEWIKDVEEELLLTRDDAYHALKAVLHSLRDRMIVEEVAHFAAEMPMLLRGMFYEGWRPAHKPERTRNQVEFLSVIEDRLVDARKPYLAMDSERLARGVFKVLRRRISTGEIMDIEATIPEEILDLWF